MNIKKIILTGYCIFLMMNIIFSQKVTTVTVTFSAPCKDSSVVKLVSRDLQQYRSYIKNNTCNFALPNASISRTYQILAENIPFTYRFLLFIKPETEMKVFVDSSLKSIKMEGDILYEEQTKFYKEWADIAKPYSELSEKLSQTKDSVEIATINNQLKDIDNKYQLFFKQWVINYPNSPFSAAIINSLVYYRNSEERRQTAIQLFTLLSPEAKKNNETADILQNELGAVDDDISKVPLKSKAPDFSVFDVYGNKISLDKFKDKVLLIDFGASWCGPCREDNPLIGNIYKKYHSKGLELLSISLDTDKNKWIEAIKKDGLAWEQGCDFKGINHVGIDNVYGISAVPSFFLISKEGIVLYKSEGLDENALTSSIEMAFKK